MLTVYGIKNCDKCRAAQKWFDGRGIDFQFHDLRTDGLDLKQIKKWQKKLTGDGLINRRSLTWRKIPLGSRNNLSEAQECELMLDYPTVIKRPIVTGNGKLHIGYNEEAWKKMF
ncbi:MAG: Spx/MgsR family RNA polymerase-binding regulatory protein [Pseudomonadota bacterium]|nr:Spx/MgsR family RNA polymerase-binding regulatory protein [Pseudomonadota bacterium]